MKHRVVVFSELYWPEGSGGELATHLFVENILAKAFDVILVTGTSKPRTRITKVIHIPWFKQMKPFLWINLYSKMKLLKNIIENADIVYIPSHKLLPLAINVKALKKNVIVILHLHNYQPITYTSVYIKGSTPSPIYDAFIEYLESENILRAFASGIFGWANILNKLAIKNADKVICVSKAQMEILKKYFNNLDRKAYVLYNPLPTVPDIKKVLSNTPSIVYSGGTSYIKGFSIALATMFEIIKKKRKMEIYITAGRSVRHKKQEILKKYEKLYPRRFALLGRLDYKEYLLLHKKLWALLFPSIWEEPLPYTVLESMALGTMPIASDVGGIKELVENTPAEKFLCRPNDIECFVDRVEYILSLNREDMTELSYKLKTLALNHFNNKSIYTKFLNIFRGSAFS